MSFDRAFAIVVGEEGGYVDDPKDPGGETKFGISKRAHPKEDIKNLTLDRARAIYRGEYWNSLGLDLRAWHEQILMFDCGVNQGTQKARDFDKDIRTRDPLEYAVMFQQARAMHYADLPTFKTYGRGWFRRLFRIFNEAMNP